MLSAGRKDQITQCTIIYGAVCSMYKDLTDIFSIKIQYKIENHMQSPLLLVCKQPVDVSEINR